MSPEHVLPTFPRGMTILKREHHLDNFIRDASSGMQLHPAEACDERGSSSVIRTRSA
jgi:hypothetical protein